MQTVDRDDAADTRSLVKGAAPNRTHDNDGRPADPLAQALPGWDLVPATQFLRRR